MLDVENVKMILQGEVDKLEDAKAKWEKYRSSDNSVLEEFYERRYRRYKARFDGMCDMLCDLGLLAWADDDNVVVVDDIPF